MLGARFDYYYPAQLLAAFSPGRRWRAAAYRGLDLVSAAPARAAGLADRGVLVEGRRADIVLVDDEVPLRPRIVAVIANGRYPSGGRKSSGSVLSIPRKAVAAA